MRLPRGKSSTIFCPKVDSPLKAKILGTLTLDDFMEARKYVKYALSALDYEDAKTAIENMTKAMQVLQKK